MKSPLYIRPLTEKERGQIQAGLRSKDAFVLRRSQVLLASARGERAPAIATQFGCHRQTVLNIIHGFNAKALAVLQEGSSRPHRLRTTFPDEALEALQDLLHRSPRDFGLDTSVWTLAHAAKISFEQGLTSRLVSGESVRRALKRLGKSWKRAKQWITSPVNYKIPCRNFLIILCRIEVWKLLPQTRGESLFEHNLTHEFDELAIFFASLT